MRDVTGPLLCGERDHRRTIPDGVETRVDVDREFEKVADMHAQALGAVNDKGPVVLHLGFQPVFGVKRIDRGLSQLDPDDVVTPGSEPGEVQGLPAQRDEDAAFALVENAPPFEMDPESLESIGPWRYDDRMLGMSTTAHPKIDGKTGQMWIHGYQPMEPYIQLYCVEPDGSVSLCELQSTDMKAPNLAARVVDRVSTFDFGAKEGIPAVTILYPIDFLPAT